VGEWFGYDGGLSLIEEEFCAVVHLLAYCDESGKGHEHDIVVFNALVSGYKGWDVFAPKWMKLLRDRDLQDFHSKEAFRYSRPYGTMIPGGAVQRAVDVRPFVNAITDGVELGVITAINARDYKLPSLHALRMKFGDDPHYFAFFFTIAQILQHYSIPADSRIGLVLDDDEGNAREVYRFLMRVKKEDRQAKRRIPSICFVDDECSPQLQAADLFSYLTRVHAEQKFLGKPSPYTELEGLDFGRSNNEKIKLRGGYIDAAYLKNYLDNQIERAKNAKGDD
jgi:hypothetical protein